MNRKRASVATFVTFLLGATLARADMSVPQPLSGQAYDRHGNLQYLESHSFSTSPRGGVESITVYRDAQGRAIARMEARYSPSPYAPDYRMIDYRFDTEHVVRREGAQVIIELRSGASRSVRRVAVDDSRPLIIGPGFNEFIRAHWDELLAGRVFVADFVIPSRSQVIGFRIRHDAGRDSASGRGFTVSVDNRLLRLVAPTLHADYDRVTRRLLTYEGPTHVTDARDRVQHVLIKFPTASQADAMLADSGLASP